MRKISLVFIFSLLLFPVLNSCKEKKADQKEDTATEAEATEEVVEEAVMNGLTAAESTLR